jgi:uracil-DNA glycosylase
VTRTGREAGDATDPLSAIAAEVRACRRCPLGGSRTQAVPGEGNRLTDVLLVGEGPGAREDATGRPFVGPAGSLLNELLASIGWERQDVFIANVVKCRPPGNRDPEPDEVAACGTYLDRQEAALDPAVIVTLGRHSLKRYLPGERIGAVHGRLRRGPAGRWVFAMYHPAAALHQASLRETLFHDMRRLPAALLEARRAIEQERLTVARESAAPLAIAIEQPPDAEQMTLF